ncbi:class I SAM-dependent methyltransferase, partial [Patescibacteria group bacterium]|nr:class I SAM-dependent methyltransferase [Patescibacteria group bacterium]
SFDIVLSSDVFEHIPKPYLAHREVYRILKKHGCHIFTAPFSPNQTKDDNRAFVNKENKIINIKTPIYHLDGIRPKKGALVFNVFGQEMLSKLKKIGFRVSVQTLFKPFRGILGNGAIVFIAQKN